MECALATFSRKEVEDILREKGFIPGTKKFRAASLRLFRPSQDVPGQYIEREDWEEGDTGNSSNKNQFDSEVCAYSRQEQVGNLPEQDAQRLLGRGYKRFVG